MKKNLSEVKQFMGNDKNSCLHKKFTEKSKIRHQQFLIL